MSIGKRLISRQDKLDPKIMSGIDRPSPKRMRSGEPFEAAAIAMTLSSDITASAMTITRTAAKIDVCSVIGLFAALVARKLDGDPEQQQTAEQF